MLNRRQFIATTLVAGAGALAASTWHVRREAREYQADVARTWRPAGEVPGTPSEVMRELVRYATLAPSSHNTQCWRFRVGDRSVSLLPDYGRRCPVVDPDDHHLFISLGCAAENLAQAAGALGFHGEWVFDAARESLDISFHAAKAEPGPLFRAIPLRQSTRSEYDGHPLNNAELRRLEAAGTGKGVQVHLLTDRQRMETVLDFVVQGNTAQMRDPAFVKELKQWIRFNGRQAADLGDGLYAGASGNPTAPPWLGSLLFDLFFTEGTENDKYARHVRSSAGIAVFTSEVDDKSHWIGVGRAFQRFALQATSMGIRTAHLNQPVEVASLRPRFAQAMGIASGRTDLVIRFGRGPEMPRSLRRPIESVLV